MYLEFFGLTEKPFTITPNPRFIFLSKNHKEVFAHLLYGIRNHSGFIEVTGEVGAGKTTVLRTLFEQLEGDDYRLAFIFNPSLSAGELLRAVCREFHIEVTGFSTGEILDALNDYLLRENQAGRTVVLVIDEAQNLTPQVLEQVRLLSNLETEGDKLIQIVLVGQPELGILLDRPDLRQLNQRIVVRYHLRPIDAEDTRAYIRHRLELAGVRDRELFSPGALRRIYRFSGGLPRLINILCDRALLVAYSEDRRQVSTAEVKRAIGELRRQSRDRRWWPLLAISGGALLLLAGILFAWDILLPGAGRDLRPAISESRTISASASSVPAAGLDETMAAPPAAGFKSASVLLPGAPIQVKEEDELPAAAPTATLPLPARGGVDSGFPLVHGKGRGDELAHKTVPVSMARAQYDNGKADKPADAAARKTVSPTALTQLTGPLRFGFVPAASGPLETPAQAVLLGDYLGQLLGQPVKVESFNNESALYEGIYRYRQIDLALFRHEIPSRINHLPLQPLVGCRSQGAQETSSCLLVARRGLYDGAAELLQTTLENLGTREKGQQVLAAAGGLAFIPLQAQTLPSRSGDLP
ncbi:hypothetical protein JCM30471_07180 [Desulfuromonas carbonis]|uniref:AAA family ATPase n=1 Tax=Desulfuromonas sp. DDH964 TaxID=1823759 RepID=UPI00078BE3D8|nr:AAA family ATPase [Desulfuromonas sp. DDH964]AMV72234.1 peptidoglycan-binding ATPase [Desulfuromonas sp. DDH964]